MPSVPEVTFRALPLSLCAFTTQTSLSQTNATVEASELI